MIRFLFILMFALCSCSQTEESDFEFAQVEFETSLDAKNYVRGIPVPISIRIQSPRTLRSLSVWIETSKSPTIAPLVAREFKNESEFRLDTTFRLNPAAATFMLIARVEDAAGNYTRKIELTAPALQIPTPCQKAGSTTVLLSLPQNTPTGPVYLAGSFNNKQLADTTYKLLPMTGMDQCGCTTVDNSLLTSGAFFTVNRGTADADFRDTNCGPVVVGLSPTATPVSYVVIKWRDLDCQ